MQQQTAQQHAAAVSLVVVGLLCASLKDDQSAEAAPFERFPDERLEHFQMLASA
jgi:hypothetical protein